MNNEIILHKVCPLSKGIVEKKLRYELYGNKGFITHKGKFWNLINDDTKYGKCCC